MPTILIVDDVSSNLNLLFDLLTAQNHKVLYAKSGRLALKRAGQNQPDLILLDVIMPDIDGFEVCRQLKDTPETADIPIIFMTALSNTENKLKGFELGAVDYLTKPINSQELLARVKTHLNLRQLQQDMQQKNEDLKNFSRMVAHDLKNPISNIFGLLSILKQEVPTKNGETLGLYLDTLTEEANRAIETVNSLLSLASIDSTDVVLATIPMNTLLDDVVKQLAPLQQEKNADIKVVTSLPNIHSHAPWLHAVFVNYISNAIKYGGSRPQIEIGADMDQKNIRYWVCDKGAGLSLEQQQKLFIPFSRLEQNRQISGHGLGLSIVKRILEKLQGQVGVESELGKGSCFFFELPVSQYVT